MADVKWIKLHTGMFDNSKIKYIRTLPEGNNMVLIWVMLLSKAGKCNASGFIFLTESIPYTSQMLAAEFGFDVYLIELALGTFSKLNMIHLENHIIQISGWEEHQNVEGLDRIREQTRKRVAKYRENQKKLPSNVSGNVTVTNSNSTEEEKEEDIEIDSNIYTHIINYLNLKSNTRYRINNKKTKGLIKARISDGFTKADFEKVIDIKVSEWINTDMQRYLRPETLFGNKFESYLNQKEGINNGNNRIRSVGQNTSKGEKFEGFRPEQNNYQLSDEERKRADEELI
ncbi:MAG: phage replisome organizer N-terminal domain-containing protein [Clostridium celatum]|nr:phage replisome organizer N-terminal domain-containing protein [Clostridium celatum]